MPRSWWDDSQYASANLGTKALKDIFGKKNFDFPKATRLIEDCLRASNVDNKSTVLDYFAGSGTTGHAVINLNREDGGRRRFVLVEMGGYFDTVLVPRTKKVMFTPEWKDGKPKRLATPEEAERAPRIVKVVRLESYEDALNNLEPRRTEEQRLLLDDADAQGPDGLREQYILRYMLDVETRGTQSLLNVQAFTDPTAYKLKVKRPGSDESREGQCRSAGDLQLADRPHGPVHRRTTDLQRRVQARQREASAPGRPPQAGGERPVLVPHGHRRHARWPADAHHLA